MTLRFLLMTIRPYWRGLSLLMGLLLAEAAIALIIPKLGGELGAEFLDDTGQTLMSGRSTAALLAAILGLLAVAALLRATFAVLYARTSETILADLRLRLFNHLMGLPLPWHQSQSRGSIMALATLEIERLGHFVTRTLVSLLPLLLTAGGATILMLGIDPALALLVPVLIPAFYLMTLILGRLMRGLAQKIQHERAGAVTLLEEMLDLLPAIKSFTAERYERKRYAEQIAALKNLSLREARISALIDPAMQFAVSASAVVLLFFAGRNLQSGKLSAAETISFLMYVALLVRPVSQLATVYGQFQTARGTLRRLQTVLSETPEPMASEAAPPHFKGDVRFESVSFAYPDRGAAVKDLSLYIRAGQTVALTGENGAGKSTIINLLLGFMRPEAGQIRLDGQDIATMPINHLRAAIGLVPQHRHLRHASVRDNITFGTTGADMAQIEAAARIAQAHDFISGLPQGYDTIIGDRGIRLSGGQQQRIVLARALLKDPAVVILDEATSMYDTDGETAFIADCREALKGRTVVLITHRPASLALADRIVTLKDGQIIQDVTRP